MSLSPCQKRRRLERDTAVATVPDDGYGDSRIDRAKTLGMLSEAKPIFKGECTFCCDQPWRRHPDGCSGCGKPFERERIPYPEPRGFSSLYLTEVFLGGT